LGGSWARVVVRAVLGLTWWFGLRMQYLKIFATEKKTERERETETERDRETEIQRDRHRERQRQRANVQSEIQY
jgi:hypothetical protein